MVVIEETKLDSMAKSSTLYDRAGLSKDSGKNIRNNTHNETKPSEEVLSFLFDYAKSSSILNSKLINSIVILNN